MSTFSNRSPRFIARQMALGFGAISLVALLTCGVLLGIVQDVSGLVASMRHDESAIHQGQELANAVRELSTRAADVLLDPQEARLQGYEQAKSTARERMVQLESHVPAHQRGRFDALEKTILTIDLTLRSVALPALAGGERKKLLAAQDRLRGLGKEAAEEADALARTTTSRMAHAHDLATDSTRSGLLVAGFGALFVIALAVGCTLRMRAAVLQPLLALTDAARRFGRGDFEQRVGQVGKGELRELGKAFDHMAEELANRERRLLENERMAAIGQLAAGVAHELNNPIGIMRGFLKTMSPGDDRATLAEELAILDEEAAHCQRITEDLVSFARAGQLTMQSFDVREFLGEVVRRFEAAHPEVHLALDVERSDLEADGTRLRQVMINLLNNGLQISEPDARLGIRGRIDGDGYLIEVWDSGPGIEAEDRARIFEPFFSKRRGGSGLGLAVCEGIVRAHGGTIRADNGAEGGAVFAVRLPLDRHHESEFFR